MSKSSGSRAERRTGVEPAHRDPPPSDLAATGSRSNAAPPSRRRAGSASRAGMVPGPQAPGPSRDGPLWPTWIGPAALGTIAVGYLALWLVARPSGEPAGRFVGELSGAEAVLLMCCALVLATLVPFIERAFGGLDRVAVWHRRAATVGFLLLVPHVAFITSSPDPYETTLGHALGDLALAGLLLLVLWALAPRLRAARWPGPIRALARTSHEGWLNAHRLTGLFVAVAARPRRDRRSDAPGVDGAARGVHRRGRDRRRRVRLPRAAREVLRADPRLHRRVGPPARTSARSRSRSTPCARLSRSRPASSSSSPSAVRPAGSAIRSRSPARPPIAGSK